MVGVVVRWGGGEVVSPYPPPTPPGGGAGRDRAGEASVPPPEPLTEKRTPQQCAVGRRDSTCTLRRDATHRKGASLRVREET